MFPRLAFPAVAFPEVAFPGLATPDASTLPVDLAHAVADRLDELVRAAGHAEWAGVSLAPPTTPLPYCSVIEDDEDDEPSDTSGGMAAAGHLRVHCYAATRGEARALGDRARAALKAAPLRFASGQLVSFWQSGRSCAPDPDEGPRGEDVWQEVRLFKFTYSYDD